MKIIPLIFDIRAHIVGLNFSHFFQDLDGPEINNFELHPHKSEIKTGPSSAAAGRHIFIRI